MAHIVSIALLLGASVQAAAYKELLQFARCHARWVVARGFTDWLSPQRVVVKFQLVMIVAFSALPGANRSALSRSTAAIRVAPSTTHQPLEHWPTSQLCTAPSVGQFLELNE